MKKALKHAIKLLREEEAKADHKTEPTISKMEQVDKDINVRSKDENCSEKPNNCEVKNYCDDCLYTDTCDDKAFFYACTSKATISKMEQVDKDINVRSKDEPQTCDTCKLKGSTKWCNNQEVCRAYKPKDEPQSLEQFRVGLEYHTDTTHFGKVKGESITTNKFEDEPQTDCAWK